MKKVTIYTEASFHPLPYIGSATSVGLWKRIEHPLGEKGSSWVPGHINTACWKPGVKVFVADVGGPKNEGQVKGKISLGQTGLWLQ